MATFSDEQLNQLKLLFAGQSSQLDKQFGSIRQQLGAINERLVRKEVVHLHGQTFADPMTINSLEDLARFVLQCDVGRHTTAQDLFDATLTLETKVLEQKASERFLRKLHDCIMSVPSSTTDAPWLELVAGLSSHPWLAGGNWDWAAIGKWLGTLSNGHSNLRNMVGAVLAVIKAGTEAEKLAALRRQDQDGSIGVALAQFAADDAPYCSLPPPLKYKDLVLPSWSVQCDVQGDIMLFEKKASIRVGEIKSSADGYSAGVEQLVRRLALLQWAVQQLRGHINDFFKVGHLYMPRDDSRRQPLKSPVRGDALINVHYV